MNLSSQRPIIKTNLPGVRSRPLGPLQQVLKKKRRVLRLKSMLWILASLDFNLIKNLKHPPALQDQISMRISGLALAIIDHCD